LGDIKKILKYSEPPGYRLKEPRPKPKIGPYLERIAQIIEETSPCRRSNATPPNGSTTDPRDGLRGKYTQVKTAVEELVRIKQEVFMPLIHRPERAQVDFGYALAKISGVMRGRVFVMVLPYSDVFFCDGL